MTIQSFYLLIVVFTFSMTQQVIAEESNRVSFTYSVPSFAPFAKLNKGQCQGAATHIVDNIFNALELTGDFQPLPYGRILYALNHRQIDTALIFKNLSVSENVEYIGPISQSKVIIITDPEKPIKRYEDLQQFEAIAVLQNANFDTTFDQDDTLNKIAVRDYDHAVDMFEKGRVDSIIGSDIGLTAALDIKDMNPSYLINAFHLNDKAWYLHITHDSKLQPFTEQINLWLKDNYRPELMLEIYTSLAKNCR